MHSSCDYVLCDVFTETPYCGNPLAELAFAGHPAIGTAHVLATHGWPERDTARATRMPALPAGDVATKVEGTASAVARPCSVAAACAARRRPTSHPDQPISAPASARAGAIGYTARRRMPMAAEEDPRWP